MTIANDLGQGGANNLAFTDLQILDLKQMADMEDSYKRRARHALKTYRNWKKLQRHQSDLVARLYGDLEGQLLRRQAQDSCRLYLMMRKDFRRALKFYLRQSGCQSS